MDVNAAIKLLNDLSYAISNASRLSGQISLSGYEECIVITDELAKELAASLLEVKELLSKDGGIQCLKSS